MAFSKSDAELDAMPPAERRTRRGQRLRNRYPSFSMSGEITEQFGPLAAQIAARYAPERYQAMVASAVELVHEGVGTAAGWAGQPDAFSKTKHLAGDRAARERAITLIGDLTQRPALLEVTAEMLIDGSWVASLAAMAVPLDAPLSALLARAAPPGSNALKGNLSRSEQLDKLLRETIDRAAGKLTRQLDQASRHPFFQPPVAQDDAARDELAKMGVAL